MLWKNESTKPDALYVDLYARCQFSPQANKLFNKTQSEINPSELRKNNALSLRKQKDGDKYFAEGKWFLAACQYDDSLRFAVNGSKNISFAYAKRSYCFLKMGMYNECLKDIELAKVAGYPADLMPDLLRREADCLTHLKNGEKTIERIAKLSYEPDGKFPCMANVLKVEKTTNGHRVIAKQDIDAGKTVVLDPC